MPKNNKRKLTSCLSRGKLILQLIKEQKIPKLDFCLNEDTLKETRENENKNTEFDYHPAYDTTEGTKDEEKERAIEYKSVLFQMPPATRVENPVIENVLSAAPPISDTSVDNRDWERVSTEDDTSNSLFGEKSTDDYIPSSYENTSSDEGSSCSLRSSCNERGKPKIKGSTEDQPPSVRKESLVGKETFYKEGFLSNKITDVEPSQVKESNNNFQLANNSLGQEPPPTVKTNHNSMNSTNSNNVGQNISSLPVEYTFNKKNQKRVWDKKYSCLYCKSLVTKLPRHLFLKHKNEKMVKEIMGLPKKDVNRLQLLNEIRNKGNYSHNINVLTVENQGNLITKKRPPRVLGEIIKKNYLPCDICLGFFSKDYLYRHLKHCTGKRTAKPKSNRNIQSRCSMLLPTTVEVDETFAENILSKMFCDSVYDIIRNDSLIINYGKNLYKKHCHEKHLHQFVSQKMREIGRFLSYAREIDSSVKSLSDLLHKNRYLVCVAAVKKIANFLPGCNSFQKPSIALKTGHNLKKCAHILKGVHILNDNEEGVKLVDQFLSYFELNWTIDVSTHALRTIQEKNWNTPKLLPLAEDIKKLNSFIKKRITTLKTELIENPNKRTWCQLSKFTLAHLIIFNRKRVGETQRLTIDKYNNMCKASMNKDVKECLSELEVKLAESLMRIETRGKRGRGVAILLTGEMKNSLDILMQFRWVGKIDEDNPYLFPTELKNCMRGSDVLRFVVSEANLEKPHLITSTKLRKHVATMSQILNLSNHELDILANFMGHDIRVHRNFYRLSEDTIQMAKVSKVLVAMEKGNISQFKGMNLDEIEIDIDEVVQEDEEQISEDETELKRRKSKEMDAGTTTENLIATETESQPKSGNVRTVPRKKSARQVSIKQPWTKEEKDAVLGFFENDIRIKMVPNKYKCEKCISRHPVLVNRSWKQVKFCVYNKIKSLG